MTLDLSSLNHFLSVAVPWHKLPKLTLKLWDHGTQLLNKANIQTDSGQDKLGTQTFERRPYTKGILEHVESSHSRGLSNV